MRNYIVNLRNYNRIYFIRLALSTVYAITIYNIWSPLAKGLLRDLQISRSNIIQPFLSCISRPQTSRHAFYTHLRGKTWISSRVSRQRCKTRFANGRIPCKINSASRCDFPQISLIVFPWFILFARMREIVFLQ